MPFPTQSEKGPMTRTILNTAWPAIRERMRGVALPDSRFDLDLDRFIPGFAGVEAATRRVVERPEYRAARTLFVTPDNSMQPLRQQALAAGKTLIVPSYGLRRGFLKVALAPDEAALALYASWGDGIEHFGVPVAVEALSTLGPIDLVLAGAAAVTINGLRFGMGHRYLDVEWNMFRAAGLVGDGTPVWTIVHEQQVLEQAVAGDVDEILVDAIFTPERVIATPQGRRPAQLRAMVLASLFGGDAPAAISRAVRLTAR